MHKASSAYVKHPLHKQGTDCINTLGFLPVFRRPQVGQINFDSGVILMTDKIDPGLIRSLARKVEELSWAMERFNLAEYVELFNKPGRLILVNFVAGVARGVGTAVGFTILGAMLVFLLRTLILKNLPGIGGFIADIVKMVNINLTP